MTTTRVARLRPPFVPVCANFTYGMERLLILHADPNRAALVPLLYFRYFRMICLSVPVADKPEQVLLLDMLDMRFDEK